MLMRSFRKRWRLGRLQRHIIQESTGDVVAEFTNTLRGRPSKRAAALEGTNKIILFVTEEKQDSLEQYADHLEGGILSCEGPTDHFAETRMLDVGRTGDEIYLFYRVRHHMDFTYMGRVAIVSYNSRTSRPSQFTLKLIGQRGR